MHADVRVCAGVGVRVLIVADLVYTVDLQWLEN